MPVDSPLHPASPHEPAGASAHRVTDPGHMLPAHATTEPSAAAKGSTGRKLIALLVLLLLVGLVVWRVHASKAESAAAAKKSAAVADRPTPVLTSAVQQKTVPVYLNALGTVTAYNTVTLHTRVDGQLMQVNFHEGQAVHQGQLLLQIDPRPYKAAVDQAEGTLAKDEANLRNTQAEAERYTALYQAGVVSKESQQTQISNAGQAAGSIKSDKAAIEAARVNLGYTSIYSPINGVVGLRQVDPGNIVHAADTTGLVVITQIHPIAIVFTLPEDQLPQVQKAMRAGGKLAVEAYNRSDQTRIATGTLLTIDNQIDTTTGTAKLKAVFDNPDGGLFPNQFVNVRLILQQLPNAIVIPTAAIQSGVNGNFVFVVRNGPTPENMRKNAPSAASAMQSKKESAEVSDGTAAPVTSAGAVRRNGGSGNGAQYHVVTVPVTVNFAQGANTILQPSALKAGDQVVIDGQEKLTDGSAVQPQQANPATVPVNNGIGGTSTAAPGTPATGTTAAPGTPATGTTAAETTGSPQAVTSAGGQSDAAAAARSGQSHTSGGGSNQ